LHDLLYAVGPGAPSQENMSGSFPFTVTRHARSSRLVRYLTLAYLALVAYASLYPFSGWRVPSTEPVAFLFADWPIYRTVSDVVLNVLAYLPLGLMLTLAFMAWMPRLAAAVLGVIGGACISLSIEYAQNFLPVRIPSNLDLLANTAGALMGAVLAYVFGNRWLLSGDLYRLRGRLFQHGASTDLGFMLLAMWLFTQLNAEIWLFGNGDLRDLLPDFVGVRFSAEGYRLLESGVTALNFCGVGFLLAAIARSYFASALALAVFTMIALALKTVASSALFVPGNPSLWLTPGSLTGLAIGVAVWLPLAAAPRHWLVRLAAVCLAVGLILVNLVPENPYFAAALKVWTHGHYVSFNHMTGTLSLVWPFLAIAYLYHLMRRHPLPATGR
jgi:VanZ family protein